MSDLLKPPLMIVFGGTSGYGEGIVRSLAAAYPDHDVVAASRRTGVDVRDPDAIARLFDSLRGRTISAIVYSAGLAIGRDHIEQGDPANWAQVFETNALGLMAVAKHSIHFLRETGGHLISLGSIASEIAYEGAADYCASKVAQARIMQTLRFELLGSGIHLSSLELGLGDTDFQKNRYQGDMAKAAAHYRNIRQLQPEDVGDLVVWLLSRPDHVNFDSIVLKPLDQAHHGKLAER